MLISSHAEDTALIYINFKTPRVINPVLPVFLLSGLVTIDFVTNSVICQTDDDDVFMECLAIETDYESPTVNVRNMITDSKFIPSVRYPRPNNMLDR